MLLQPLTAADLLKMVHKHEVRHISLARRQREAEPHRLLKDSCFISLLHKSACSSDDNTKHEVCHRSVSDVTKGSKITID